MFDRMTAMLQFDGEALALRAHRQQVLASNIANGDTPGYQARDFDFGKALASAYPTAPAGSQGGSLPALHTGAAPMRVAFAPQAGAGTVTAAPARAHAAFLPLRGDADPSRVALSWRTPEQPSLDGNTVDLDRERASFADNSLRYEATLRFINSHVRTMMSAIRGD